MLSLSARSVVIRALSEAIADYGEMSVVGELADLVKLASQDRLGDSYNRNINPECTVDELVAYTRVGKIEAIKLYRTRTGLGLRESIEAVERDVAKLELREVSQNPAGAGKYLPIGCHVC